MLHTALHTSGDYATHSITYMWGLCYTQHYIQVGTMLHTALHTSGDYGTNNITHIQVGTPLDLTTILG